MEIDAMRDKKLMEVFLRYYDNLSALVRKGMASAESPKEMQAFRVLFGNVLTSQADKSFELIGDIFICYPQHTDLLVEIRAEYARFSEEYEAVHKLYPQPPMTLGSFLGVPPMAPDPESQN